MLYFFFRLAIIRIDGRISKFKATKQGCVLIAVEHDSPPVKLNYEFMDCLIAEIQAPNRFPSAAFTAH